MCPILEERGERQRERERERSRFIQTLSHSVRLAKTRLSILARPCVHRSPLFPSSSFHGFIYFAFYLRLAAPSCPLFLFPVHAYTSPPTCQRAFCCSFQAVGGCKRGWLHGEERPRGHVELESLGPSHDPTTDGSIQRIRGLLENRDFVSCVGRFV